MLWYKQKQRKRRKWWLWILVVLFLMLCFCGKDTDTQANNEDSAEPIEISETMAPSAPPTQIPELTPTEVPTPTPAPTEEPTPTPAPTERMVWIPQSGSKYHKYSSCSGMKSPSEVMISQAIAWGFTACKRCW